MCQVGDYLMTIMSQIFNNNNIILLYRWHWKWNEPVGRFVPKSMECKLGVYNLKLSQPLSSVILSRVGWCLGVWSMSEPVFQEPLLFLSSVFPDASANPRKFYWILESVSCHVRNFNDWIFLMMEVEISSRMSTDDNNFDDNDSVIGWWQQQQKWKTLQQASDFKHLKSWLWQFLILSSCDRRVKFSTYNEMFALIQSYILYFYF